MSVRTPAITTVENRFLTPLARCYVQIVRNPEVKLDDLASTLGVTKGRVSVLISSLVSLKMIVRTKVGRRNVYKVGPNGPKFASELRDIIAVGSKQTDVALPTEAHSL